MWGKRRASETDQPLEQPAGIATTAEAAPIQIETARLTPAAEQDIFPIDAGTPQAEPMAASAPSNEQLEQLLRSKLVPAAFGNIVSLFMRSPAHRHYSLMDLEWLVLPPLALNQFALAEAKLPNDQTMPAALVLWAQVSEEIDARLSANPRYPIRLHPNEWKSGEIIWIVDIVGDQRPVQEIMERLGKTAFEGKQVRMLANETKKTAELN